MTRAIVFVCTLMLLISTTTAGASCTTECSTGTGCASYGAYSYCVPLPTPVPGRVCATVYDPVCCKFRRRVWFGFEFVGNMNNSNSCDCYRKGGFVCQKEDVQVDPIAIPPSTGGGGSPPPVDTEPTTDVRICTMEYAPVCCRDPITNMLSTKSNKCQCGDGTVTKEGPC